MRSHISIALTLLLLALPGVNEANPHRWICEITGGNGDIVECPISMVRASAAEPAPSDAELRLVWDSGRVTLLGFEDAAAVEAPICEAHGAGCGWSSLSTSGHSVAALPSDRAGWTEWVRLLFFHDDESERALTDAFLEDGAVIGGDAIFYKARFRLREGISADRPSYVWLTDERFSLANGLSLSVAPQTIGGARYVVVSEGWVGDPELSASPTSHYFGEVARGAHADHDFVVTNTGDADLSITALFIIGRDPDEFSVVTDGCGGRVIASGAHCSATLRFRPEDGEEKEALLVIRSDDAVAPLLQFALSGSGTLLAAAETPSADSGLYSNLPPTAHFTLSTHSGGVPLSIIADASGSSDEGGAIVAYHWTASNGQSAVGPVASLLFTEAGSYVVNLTVTDEDGASSSLSQRVEVSGGEALCAQVITWGLDPRSGEWREFPTPCDVPRGWESSTTDPFGASSSHDFPLNLGVLSANGASGAVTVGLGGSIEVRYAMLNFDPGGRLDVYLALSMPGGAMLFLQPREGVFSEPSFSLLPAPYLANSAVADREGAVLNIRTLPPTLPVGHYTFYAVPVLSGANPLDRDNWMGPLASVRVIAAP